MHHDTTSLTLTDLGRISMDDVPYNGYEDYQDLKTRRSRVDYYRRDDKAGTLVMGGFSLVLLLPALAFIGAIPTSVAVFLLVMGLVLGGFSTVLAFSWRKNALELAGMPETDSVLPPHATPELAEQEGVLLGRVERHRRHVRRLRARGNPGPEAVEKAAEEERDIRSEIGALAAANTDIAGLLTD